MVPTIEIHKHISTSIKFSNPNINCMQHMKYNCDLIVTNLLFLLIIVKIIVVKTTFISFHQNCAEIRKINQQWLKPNQFWKWSGWIGIPHFRSFHPCTFQKTAANIKLHPVLKVVRIHHLVKFETISSMLSPDIAQKPLIGPISVGWNCAKSRKSSNCGLNLIVSEGGWYKSILNVRPFLPCVIHKLHGNLSGRTRR